jgi:STE24 endopeptidase
MHTRTHTHTLCAHVCSRPPAELKDSISPKVFEAARAYSLDKSSFTIAKSCFGLVVGVAMLVGGFMPWAWNVSEVMVGTDASELVVSLVYLNFTSLIETVMELPWSVYHTFVIEETHGFNKQTVVFFIKDQLKQLIVNSAIFTAVMWLILAVIQYAGDNFFIYAWGTVFGISVILFMV